MKLNIEKFSRLPARERVNLVLVMARMVLSDLEGDQAGEYLANLAINLVSVWVNEGMIDGRLVTGEDFLDVLQDENDHGLLVFVDSGNPKSTDHAFNVVGGVVSYAAWCAFLESGDVLPEGIEEVTDVFVQWIIDEAISCNSFDGEMVSDEFRDLLF
ncbi:Imm6 family immunity protein [Pseudoxanthomonas broegbernensis]|nr:Imm6 family immunity protein [Pseudoxanthomonas broegbernensis]MBB6065904.1 anion-transporting ArsA/GET3 family ATPase [Pseudoxanthomonas broegbernensis]